MTLDAIDAWWWPYLFILLAGWLVTDFWRVLGVAFSGRISETSESMVLVRTIATALVAAVIGNLLIFPGGPLADTTVPLRLAAAATGFAAYLGLGRRIVLGIAAAEAVLLGGMALGF